MARVWPAYEGKEPTRAGPWAVLPASEAISLFELRVNDLISHPTGTPRFGDTSRDLWFFGYKHIVIEFEDDEPLPENWKPGFYRSLLSPGKAFGKLIRRALASALGDQNVLDVRWEPSTDSTGADALRVLVVITPAAVQTLEGDALIEAIVKLREQLNEMGDTRTPIIEYATEEELAEDDAPQS